jgi:hypothetical protein
MGQNLEDILHIQRQFYMSEHGYNKIPYQHTTRQQNQYPSEDAKEATPTSKNPANNLNNIQRNPYISEISF